MRKPKYLDISGRVYGRLKVLKYVGVRHECALWICRCYCGNLTETTIGQLHRTSKPTRSCNRCYDNIKYPVEYNSWRSMHARCYTVTNQDYPNYGGRGITVSKEWRLDFFNFLIDMGFKPDLPDISIDRINNDLGYSKENCRWATRLEQNNNKRPMKQDSMLQQINKILRDSKKLP